MDLSLLLQNQLLDLRLVEGVEVIFEGLKFVMLQLFSLVHSISQAFVVLFEVVDIVLKNLLLLYGLADKLFDLSILILS